MADFIDPSQLTPLFTAQQVACAYPVSDSYADCPRYLYYALLVTCLVVSKHSWLAHAFLGAAATYAGVAAIEAFILIAGFPETSDAESISIPFVSSASIPGNETYHRLTNLVTDANHLPVQPYVMDLDVDAILAIVVVGYLFMLPVHCWSNTIRGHRARHLLFGLWNVLMLCGTICALIMWNRLSDTPYQYRFCYPSFPDIDTITSDGWISGIWEGSWNSTVWNAFSNQTTYNELSDSCLYPCFNTSQVLRRQSSITASVNTGRSPRTNYNLTARQVDKYAELAYFVYIAIIISAITAVALLALTATRLRNMTTIPVHRPALLWRDRARIWKNLSLNARLPFTRTSSDLEKMTVRRPMIFQVWAVRMFADVLAVLLLLSVIVIVPATLVAFIVWIEWWIHRDIVSLETPRQVGQWGTAVSVGLVLLSALVLRLKYVIASEEEIDEEINEIRQKLEELQRLKEKKMLKSERQIDPVPSI